MFLDSTGETEGESTEFREGNAGERRGGGKEKGGRAGERG